MPIGVTLDQFFTRLTHRLTTDVERLSLLDPPSNDIVQSPNASIRYLLGMQNKYNKSNSEETAKVKGAPHFP